MKVLVAEDDRITREGLAEILRGEGYDVVLAADGRSALELFSTASPDFACLDIMMPQLNGFELCKIIRQKSDIPVVFISAKSEEVDKVVGLELGADDFIVKPFGVKEVVARIRAVTRRCHALRNQADDDESFSMNDLIIYPNQLRALRASTVIDLSLRDVRILRLLFEHRGNVVDRNMLFNEAWGIHYLPNSRTLDQHISQLRKRIELNPKNPLIIRTVHGVGYRFE